jgi:hypothetical protein
MRSLCYSSAVDSIENRKDRHDEDVCPVLKQALASLTIPTSVLYINVLTQ